MGKPMTRVGARSGVYSVNSQCSITPFKQSRPGSRPSWEMGVYLWSNTENTVIRVILVLLIQACRLDTGRHKRQCRHVWQASGSCGTVDVAAEMARSRCQIGLYFVSSFDLFYLGILLQSMRVLLLFPPRTVTIVSNWPQSPSRRRQDVKMSR